MWLVRIYNNINELIFEDEFHSLKEVARHFGMKSAPELNRFRVQNKEAKGRMLDRFNVWFTIEQRRKNHEDNDDEDDRDDHDLDDDDDDDEEDDDDEGDNEDEEDDY